MPDRFSRHLTARAAQYFAHSRLLPVVLALFLAACSGKQDSMPPPPVEVSVITAASQSITLYEEYVGQTEAADTVEIRARVNGILERQAFADGGRVRKGEVLFVIDQQPYLAALAQAKAAVSQTQANQLNSRQNLERVRPLLNDHAISQQDVDAAVAKEAADAAALEAARAQVKTAELNLDYTTVRAPRDGVMSKALIKPGGLINASTTLLTTLYSVDPMFVNFTINEQKLLDLQRELKRNLDDDKGRSPPFRLKLVDGSEYKHPARLNFVDAALDAKSGTLQLRLSVPNPERQLRAGQFVRVIVPGVRALDAIRVPQQAVQELQGKRSIFIVDADNKATYREITAHSRLENDWVVTAGVQPGERIIVEGAAKVRAATPVKPTPMAGAGGGAQAQPAALSPDSGKSASGK